MYLMMTARGMMIQLRIHVVPLQVFKMPCTVKATTAGHAICSMMQRIMLTFGRSLKTRVCSASIWYRMIRILLAPCNEMSEHVPSWSYEEDRSSQGVAYHRECDLPRHTTLSSIGRDGIGDGLCLVAADDHAGSGYGCNGYGESEGGDVTPQLELMAGTERPSHEINHFDDVMFDSRLPVLLLTLSEQRRLGQVGENASWRVIWRNRVIEMMKIGRNTRM